MPSSIFEDALAALNSVIDSSIALATQLDIVISNLATLKDARSDSNGQAQQPLSEQLVSASGPIDALSLAHDSAALIKAHATKISLLIINEPFTPTAITKVLRELVAGPLPSLTAAVELCVPERYTGSIQRDLAWRAVRVLREVRELISRVPRDGKVLVDDKKNAPAGAAGGRGSIATTGMLWSTCDDVMAFCKRGFAGTLTHKVNQLKDTLKDVMEELKEWGEEADDSEEDGDEDDGDGDIAQITSGLGSSSISGAADAQSVLDDLMNSQRHIPRDDPERIRERLDLSLKRLRLIILLYQATVKRRLKPLPSVPPAQYPVVPIRLDEAVAALKRIPEKFGSLAMAFYELDRSEIDRLLEDCSLDALAACEILVKPWEGEKDEFTDWGLRFQVELKKD
ncbi:hypothetical protein B0J18DRAFT_435272 [Chaetomium sp. MPI-SDFR-AT-0129]|nr:hypothetical protein B0J18DRAFT_435272 [Chaetomium sp. MPI-SDFR-AT-0129]